jgi:hypothetical protein
MATCCFSPPPRADYQTLLHVKYIIILLSTEVDNIANAKEKKHQCWLRIYDRLSPPES